MYPQKVGKRKISLRKVVFVWAVFVLCCLMTFVLCVVGAVVRPVMRTVLRVVAVVSFALGVWVALFGGCLLFLWLLLFVCRNRRWLC